VRKWLSGRSGGSIISTTASRALFICLLQRNFSGWFQNV
jgi:hypothetical protein